MPTGSVSSVISIAGFTFTSSSGTVDADHANIYGDSTTEIVLAAGTAVASWDESTSSTGTATLSSGHGLTSGTFDVYWTGGQRYGVSGTVTSNSLALTGGSGDNYPADGEATMVVCKQQIINTAIDGDAVSLLVLNSTVGAHLHFLDGSAGSVWAKSLAANNTYSWYSTSGVANPLTGNPVTVCHASNNTTTAGILFIGTLEDSTP